MQLNNGLRLNLANPVFVILRTMLVTLVIALTSLSCSFQQSHNYQNCRNPDAVLGLVFSPDGTRLVSLHKGKICLWDVSSGKVLRDLETGPKRELTEHSVAFSADGKSLGVSAPPNVSIIDANTGSNIRSFTVYDPGENRRMLDEYMIAFDSNCSRAAVERGGSIDIWDISHGRLVNKLAPAYLPVRFSSDGGRLGVGNSRQPYQVWDVLSGQKQKDIYHEGIGYLSSDFNTSATYIFRAPDVELTGVDSRKVLIKVADGSTVRDLEFSPNGVNVALLESTESGALLELWNASSGIKLRSFASIGNLKPSIFFGSGPSWDLKKIVFSPNGKMIAGLFDLPWMPAIHPTAHIVLWDLNNNEPGKILSIPGYGAEYECSNHHESISGETGVQSIAFSPDSKIIACGFRDGLHNYIAPESCEYHLKRNTFKPVVLWDISANKELSALPK